MFEYRILNLSEKEKSILEEKNFILIEEEFKDFKGFIIYADSKLKSVLNSLKIDFEIKELEETNWENKWKEFLKPDLLIDDIYFVFDDEDYSYENKIKILPALAFGTGTHPTTKVAARLLSKIVKNKTVIDVGCGSGILSIASEILGANKIIAFDIDDVAIGNTKTNIEWNNCEKIYLYAGGIDSLSDRFNPEIIVANIITQVLSAIRNDIYSKKPEYIVLSGILQTEYNDFIKSFLIDEYEIIKKEIMNEWCGVLLKRR